MDAAFQVLGARLDSLPLTVHRDFANAQLQIDQTRLEQILVNLIGNALDAMQAQAAPQLWLEGQSGDGKYRLLVVIRPRHRPRGAQAFVRTLLPPSPANKAWAWA